MCYLVWFIKVVGVGVDDLVVVVFVIVLVGFILVC